MPDEDRSVPLQYHVQAVCDGGTVWLLGEGRIRTEGSEEVEQSRATQQGLQGLKSGQGKQLHKSTYAK